MELRPLGATGISVSTLAFGTVKFGRDRGVKYPTAVTIPDAAAAGRLLARARELGVNLLDTAPAYGDAEVRLGALLGRQAGDWVIATKVGETFDGERSHFDFSAAAVQASVLRSLQRLRRDWLDVVLVHSDGSDRELLARGDCVDALQRLKQSGHIRAVGFSGKTVAGGLQAVRCCDVVMVNYSRAATDERVVIDAARAAGCGVLVKKPLDSGWLVHAGAVAGDPASGDQLTESLGFVVSTPGVSSVVVGTTSLAHLEQNAAAVAHPALR